MGEKIFLSEMAKELRISTRALRARINGAHRCFWEGKIIPGYRKSADRADFEKYIAWMKRSGLEDARGRKPRA